MQQKLMAIAFLLASLGHAEIAFLAFSDNECTEPLTMESPEFFDGQPLNGLPITASITDVERANGKWYDDVSFPGATTSSSTGTQKKVYWQAPRPDRECAFLLMKAFDRSMDHTTISKLNGEIIINARKQGCYYSSLDDHTTLITTFCCGEGDCGNADLGAGLISKRDEVLPAPSLPTFAESPHDAFPKEQERRAMSPTTHASEAVRHVDIKSTKDGTTKRTTIITKRDDPAPPSSCKVLETFAEFRAVGNQVALTNTQQCGSGGGQEVPCTFAAGQEKTFESALSTEDSYTLTTETGFEQSISADATFLGTGVTSTTTLSFSMSEAWTKTTGKQVTNGKASSTQNTLQQEPGTTAFLSFVPIYQCWSGKVRCESDDNDSFEGEQSFCIPGGDGGLGYYSIVYTALGTA